MAKFVKCEKCGYYPVESGYICTKCGTMQSTENKPVKEKSATVQQTDFKKQKKNILKPILIVFGIIVVIAGFIFTGKYFLFDKSTTTDIKPKQDTLHNKITIDTTNLILARVEDNNKIYFIDTTGRIYINKGFDAANNFREGLAAVNVNGKWGYIDVKGNIIIEPQFELAGNFSEGFACIGKKDIKIEGKYVTYDQFGFIDKTGKIVIPIQYFYSSSSEFSEGLADVSYMDERGDFYYAFINKNGGKVISMVNNEKIKHAGKFINGKAKVETQSGLFLINKNGIITEKTSNQDFSIIDNKFDFGIYPDKEPNKSLGVVDEKTGAPLCVTGLCGYKNKAGVWIIKPKYSFTGDFSYTYISKSIVINNDIKKTSEENYNSILLKSYKALENSSFDATDYFSENVDLYITMKNTSPAKINSYINNSFYKEFQNPSYIIEENGYSEEKIENGEYKITFIEKLNCFRKSKQKNQILRTKIEVIFNTNNKIRYWKQLQILQNDYL